MSFVVFNFFRFETPVMMPTTVRWKPEERMVSEAELSGLGVRVDVLVIFLFRGQIGGTIIVVGTTKEVISGLAPTGG